MELEKILAASIGVAADVCSLTAVAFCIDQIPNVMNDASLVDTLPPTFQTLRTAGIALASCIKQLDSRGLSVEECKNLVGGIEDLKAKTSTLYRALAEDSVTANLYADLLVIAVTYCDFATMMCRDRLPRSQYVALEEATGDVRSLVGYATRAPFWGAERRSLQKALGMQLKELESFGRSISYVCKNTRARDE